MKDFVYHRPSSLDEATGLLAGAEDAKLLAGGMTLLPTMKQRLAMPSDIIDISGLSGLSGITVTADSVEIGAATKHAAVASSAEVQAAIPALAKLAGGIGDPQVRNRGTMGGSVANSDPAADYPAAVLGLGATIVTDRRSIDADSFFTGLFETALEEDEIITKIVFPIPEAAAYVKFPSPASRYALVGVFVAKTKGGLRVAVTGAGPCAFRATDFETALAKEFSPTALAGVTVPADGLNADIHADAEYRAHLVGVTARRAVAEIANGGAA